MRSSRFSLSSAPALAVLLSLALAGCNDGSSRPTLTSDVALTAGDAAQKEGRSAQAAEYYMMALSRSPGDPDLRIKAAKAQRAAGQPAAALEILKPLTAQASSPVDALVEAARAALQAERTETARGFAQRAVDRQPGNADAQLALGIALNASGQHAAADAAYQAALAAGAADVAPILNNLGLSQAQQGQIDAALATLRRAESIDPDNAVTQDNIKLVQAIAQSGAVPAPVPVVTPKPMAAAKPVAVAEAVTEAAPVAVVAEAEPVSPAVPASGKPATPQPETLAAAAPQPLIPQATAAADPAPKTATVKLAAAEPPAAAPVAAPAKNLTPSEQLSMAMLKALKDAPKQGASTAVADADLIESTPATPVALTGDIVNFRYGHEPRRDRLVLDNADTLNARAQISDGRLTLSLPAGSQIKRDIISDELARSVAQIEHSQDGSSLSLTLKPGVKAKTYRLGDRLVVDFTR